MPEVVKKERHIFIQVNSIEEAVKQFDYVAFPRLAINEKLAICFAVKDSVLFELTEIPN